MTGQLIKRNPPYGESHTEDSFLSIATVVLIPVTAGKAGQFFYDMGIPDGCFQKPFTGKIRANPAKRNAVPQTAPEDRAAAGLFPFFAFSAGFDAAFAKAILLFWAAGTTLSAGGDGTKIDLFVHYSPNPLLILTTKSCTLVTIVFTPRLPRSRSLFTENSEISTL